MKITGILGTTLLSVLVAGVWVSKRSDSPERLVANVSRMSERPAGSIPLSTTSGTQFPAPASIGLSQDSVAGEKVVSPQNGSLFKANRPDHDVAETGRANGDTGRPPSTPSVKATAPTVAHSGRGSTQAHAREAVDFHEAYQSFFDMYAVSHNARAHIDLILSNSTQETTDILRLSREKGLSVAETSQLISESQGNTESQLNQVLGVSTTKAFQEYRTSLPFRPMAEDFAQRCASRGAPVAPDVIDAITVILKDNNTTASGRPNWSKTQERLQTAALDAAEKKLSPPQLEEFRRLLNEHRDPVSYFRGRKS